MKLKKTIALTVFVFIAALALAACAPKSVDPEILDNISDLRTNIYTAETEAMDVVVITGKRERPYKVDGKSEPKSDYTAISIKPAELPAEGRVYEYVLTAGKSADAGRFTAHPFGVTYTAELPRSLTGEVSIKIKSENYEEEFALTSRYTDGMLTWEQALETGLNAVKTEVSSLYADKKFNGEVYVQFISDPLQNDGGYFWYVAFAGGGKTYAALLDPTTGQIMACKKI
jgi:hypothetical protein